MRVRNKFLSLCMLVCMLVMAVPTSFFAEETQEGTISVNVICYYETDEEGNKIPLEGTGIGFFVTNTTSGPAGGPVVGEQTTIGTNNCEITYRGDKFIYDGTEYSNLGVIINNTPVDYYPVDYNYSNLYSVADLQANAQIEYQMAKNPVYTAEVKKQVEGYKLVTEYKDGVYNYSYLTVSPGYYTAEGFEEAVGWLTEEDTSVYASIDYAEGQKMEVSAKALATLKEKNAMLSLWTDDFWIEWDPVDQTSDFSFAMTSNASVTADLDAANIPYLMFEAKGFNGSKSLWSNSYIDRGVLDNGTWNAETHRYEDEKLVYYYNADKNYFSLCEKTLYYKVYGESETVLYDEAEINFTGETFPTSGYYVVVDEALPVALTQPRETVEIAQAVVGSNEVVELDAALGVVPAGSKLSVSKITEGEKLAVAQKALETVVTEKTKVHLFDITLLSADDIKIQPDGSVTITITLGETVADTEKVTVYRIEDDGTKTLIEGAKIENGKVVFNTNHFSTYAILIGEVATSVPKTGDSSALGFYVTIMFVGVAFMLVNKKYIVK